MGIAAEMKAREIQMADEAAVAATATDDNQGTTATPAENSGDSALASTPATSKPAPKPEASEPPEPQTIPYAAMKSEREKRQKAQEENFKLQGELEALKRLLQQQPGAPRAEPKPAPSKADLEAKFWEDPMGFLDSRYREAWESERAREWRERLVDDEADMRDEHADYDELSRVFIEAVRSDPKLERRMFRQQRPAQFAYEWAKRHVEQQKASTEKEKSYEAKIAELEAKLKENSAALEAANVPQTNAGSKGSGISAAEPREETGSRAALYSRHRNKSF